MLKLKCGLAPIHPGEIFYDGYLKEKNISVSEFSKSSGISEEYLFGFISRKKDVTPEIAEKLANAIGTSKEIWLLLQIDYDTRMYGKPSKVSLTIAIFMVIVFSNLLFSAALFVLHQVISLL